jgi:ABC-type oligopeptide transport system substrate-binding subunit
VVFHNLNRQSLYNFNDNTVAVSGKSAEQVARTTAAMGNVHFRRALCCAVDRAGYNAQSVGEDLKLVSLRNSYVPGDFITLTESVAVGGRLYPAGTAYGRILQDQLNADGVKITVYDGDSDGFDGWYNPAYAREELEKALQELDIEITNNAPILLDFPYFSGSEVNTNRAYAYKQSVENALGGLVRVELIPCSDRADVLYAGFYAGLGSEANYDVYDIAGWGPDYGDPQTYLYTLLPDYAGDMTRMLGIF